MRISMTDRTNTAEQYRDDFNTLSQALERRFDNHGDYKRIINTIIPTIDILSSFYRYFQNTDKLYDHIISSTPSLPHIYPITLPLRPLHSTPSLYPFIYPFIYPFKTTDLPQPFTPSSFLDEGVGVPLHLPLHPFNPFAPSF